MSHGFSAHPYGAVMHNVTAANFMENIVKQISLAINEITLFSPIFAEINDRTILRDMTAEEFFKYVGVRFTVGP